MVFAKSAQNRDTNSMIWVIKTVLASVTTGRTLVPSLKKLTGMRIDHFLQLFLCMYADFCPRTMLAPDKSKAATMAGTTAENQEWAAGLFHFTTCLQFCQAGMMVNLVWHMARSLIMQ